jgi:8-hydroxy-5-deazaflavin:NADPH oxidoreductase
VKIAIVGAGNIGGTLTRRLTALGHDVAVANSRGPDTLADLAAETGARAVTVSEAPEGAQLVIVTIPEKRIPELPDVGLDDSWRQQPGTPVYGTDLDANGVRQALAQASRDRPAEFIASDDGPGG